MNNQPNQDEELGEILRKGIKLALKNMYINAYEDKNPVNKSYAPDLSSEQEIIILASSIKQWAIKMVGEDFDIKDHHQECYPDCHRCIEILAINFEKLEIRQRIERG